MKGETTLRYHNQAEKRAVAAGYGRLRQLRWNRAKLCVLKLSDRESLRIFIFSAEKIEKNNKRHIKRRKTYEDYSQKRRRIRSR